MIRLVGSRCQLSRNPPTPASILGVLEHMNCRPTFLHRWESDCVSFSTAFLCFQKLSCNRWRGTNVHRFACMVKIVLVSSSMSLCLYNWARLCRNVEIRQILADWWNCYQYRRKLGTSPKISRASVASLGAVKQTDRGLPESFAAVTFTPLKLLLHRGEVFFDVRDIFEHPSVEIWLILEWLTLSARMCIGLLFWARCALHNIQLSRVIQ